MKYLRKIIIITICIIIILTMTLIFILKTNSNDETGGIKNKSNNNQVIVEEAIVEEEGRLQILDYFIIKQCIQKYVDTLNKQNTVYYEVTKDNNYQYNENIQKARIYDLLSESYITTKKIDKNNIGSKIQLIDEKKMFYPLEIENLSNDKIKKYKVKGIIQNIEYNNRALFYCVVNSSIENKIFSIEPLEEEEYNRYNNRDMETIEKNDSNTYFILSINEEKEALEYFNIYKFLTFANPKFTYDKMTEEYRNKRFGTLEKYEEYIKSNYNEMKNSQSIGYLTRLSGDKPQYVIKDQYENLYIFDAKSPVDFTVRLDTYTLEEEKFNTAYDQGDEQKKCQMNIDKFFQMINRQDYKTSYKHLADSFKETSNIKTEDDFEKIAKQVFLQYNKVEYLNYEEIGNNTYMFKLKLTDITGKNNEEKNITIIMQLRENRDFVMSFS